jgi:hypothetical protein
MPWRNAIMVRLSVLVLTLSVVPLPSWAQVQQVADSTFVPSVSQPAFMERPLRILFDEAHDNFHTLDGRYRAFGTLLKADGCALTSNHEAFSAERLAPSC